MPDNKEAPRCPYCGAEMERKVIDSFRVGGTKAGPRVEAIETGAGNYQGTIEGGGMNGEI